MNAKILIIDDDLALLDLMSATLLRAGFEVLTAQDGVLGAKLFKTHHPELVITDILMPEREGIETICALKLEPEPPVVIAISGGGRMAGHDFLELAKALGADAILPKPFQMSMLVALVRRMLGEDPPASAGRAEGRPEQTAPGPV